MDAVLGNAPNVNAIDIAKLRALVSNTTGHTEIEKLSNSVTENREIAKLND